MAFPRTVSLCVDVDVFSLERLRDIPPARPLRLARPFHFFCSYTKFSFNPLTGFLERAVVSLRLERNGWSFLPERPSPDFELWSQDVLVSRMILRIASLSGSLEKSLVQRTTVQVVATDEILALVRARHPTGCVTFKQPFGTSA